MATAFKDMTKDERTKWLAQQQKEGKLDGKGVVPSLAERVRNSLKHRGPLTTKELAEEAGSTVKGVTNWAGKNAQVLAEAGIKRHVSPDDGRTHVWFLDDPKPSKAKSKVKQSADASDSVEADERKNGAGSTVLAKMRSSVASR